MADDLTTFSGVEIVLAATCDYDFTGDVDKGKRRAAALRRKLDFAEATGRGEQNVRFNVQAVQDQLRQCLAWLQNNLDQTDAQKMNAPDVLHADFSTFRGYSIYTPPVITPSQ